MKFRRYTDEPLIFSKPDALSPHDPQFQAARMKACTAVLEALEEFEKATGRIVSGVALHHIDATTLDAPAPVYVRDVYVLWRETEAERSEDLEMQDAAR